MAQEDLNRIALRNSSATYSVDPPCRDSDINGTKAPSGGHSAEMNTKYEHWCRPEPTREFPYKSADVERAREKQGGMQDGTDLPRNDVGAVKGSQNPVTGKPGNYAETGWGEWGNKGGSPGTERGFDQWDREQEHTYGRGESKEPFDD